MNLGNLYLGAAIVTAVVLITVKALNADVLLIVDGAVIGPIEPEMHQSLRPPAGGNICFSSPPPGSGLCAGIYKFERGGNVASWCARGSDRNNGNNYPLCTEGVYESIEQTCARAMKEIGAIQIRKYGPSEQYPTGILTFGEHEETGPLVEEYWVLPSAKGDVWPYDNERVRCIPAPSGLN